MDDIAFADLMARVRAGDEGAARVLFDRYARRLVGLARTRLDPLLRRKVDPEDVVQSVFRNFFMQLQRADGRWELGGWDGLWGLLTVLTVRRCSRWAGHFRAGCRDARREAAPPGSADDSASGQWAVAGPEPTPEAAVVLAEAVEEVFRRLPDRDRQIVGLALQGYTTDEIAVVVECSGRTVERVLALVRDRLERQRDAAEGVRGRKPPEMIPRGVYAPARRGATG